MSAKCTGSICFARNSGLIEHVQFSKCEFLTATLLKILLRWDAVLTSKYKYRRFDGS